jgi:hypothetical protein
VVYRDSDLNATSKAHTQVEERVMPTVEDEAGDGGRVEEEAAREPARGQEIRDSRESSDDQELPPLRDIEGTRGLEPASSPPPPPKKIVKTWKAGTQATPGPKNKQTQLLQTVVDSVRKSGLRSKTGK